jgi:hypothetical protein
MLTEQFKCQECEREFKNLNYLSTHISKSHNPKDYYDKWIKNSNENKCVICGSETPFMSIKQGYKDGCSKKCIDKIKIIKREKSNLEKYGNKNYNNIERRYKTNNIKYGGNAPMCDNKIKEKTEQTCLKKYGVTHIFKSEKIKNDIKHTNIKKYGVENPSQSEKIKIKKENTCLKHYNVKNPNQSPEIKNKIKNTNIQRYGVEHNMQNVDTYNKGLKTRKLIKLYKNDLYYQGSYEFEFLEKYYEKYPNIIRGKTIKYTYNDKNKVYFPDFFIPSLNLIIEIKSSWTLKQDIEIDEKKKAVYKYGYNYIMILDKDYTQFNNLISNE